MLLEQLKKILVADNIQDFVNLASSATGNSVIKFDGREYDPKKVDVHSTNGIYRQYFETNYKSYLEIILTKKYVPVSYFYSGNRLKNIIITPDVFLSTFSPINIQNRKSVNSKDDRIKAMLEILSNFSDDQIVPWTLKDIMHQLIILYRKDGIDYQEFKIIEKAINDPQ